MDEPRELFAFISCRNFQGGCGLCCSRNPRRWRRASFSMLMNSEVYGPSGIPISPSFLNHLAVDALGTASQNSDDPPVPVHFDHFQSHRFAEKLRL